MGVQTQAFPRGITDPGGTTAFLNVSGDEIVAVDLATGALDWRRPGAGRPLTVTDGGLLVVRRRQRRIELDVLDRGTGADLRPLGPLPAPDWAADEWDHDGFLTAATGDAGSRQVTWRVVRRYHGGAAPPAELLAATGTEAAGTVRVDVDAGRLHPEPDADPAVLEESESGRTLREVTSGGRVFELGTRSSPDGTTAVILSARREGEHEPLWETVLDRRARRGPPPLRP